MDWCYFETDCSIIQEKIPDMYFTFEIESEDDTIELATYSIPSKSFLFSDVDLRNDKLFCHLGIVTQKFSDVDHFILGQVFMEHFYATFDATDDNFNLIGLSYQDDTPKSTLITEVAFFLTCAVLIILMTLIGIIKCCINKRK